MKLEKQHGKLLFMILIMSILLMPRQAEAGFMDRIKGIYQAPDKVDELKALYDESVQEIEEQKAVLLEQKQQLEQQLELQKQQLEAQMIEQREQMESQLQEQGRQLEQARSQSESLEQRQQAMQQDNEMYKQQNKALAEQNEQLQRQLEQAREERLAWLRKLAVTIGALVLLLIAYMLAMRVWRYAVWRRQRSGERHDGDQQEAMT